MTALKIGIALGGGGARGFAHVPMLEAIDELGITPAMITGCSMGAIIAAAYASGMSGKDIRAHIESLLANRMDFARYVFGKRQTKITDLLSFGSLQSLHLEGAKLADLALPDHLPKMIEDTKIPLKLIATDFERMEETVFTSGPLLEAVGASIAIPGLIASPRINGRLHVDGGVTNPVPFDHLRADCDVVVAIDVTGKPKPLTAKKPGNLETAVGSLFIMFNQLAATRRALSPPDVYVVPPVDQFSTGDFFGAPAIMSAAATAKDELKRKLEKVLGAQLIEGR
jgi:NTE family protein